MKSLKQFLDQAAVENPQVGDSIGFELDFESMVESSVVELLEDGVLVDVDDAGMTLLENAGFKFETITRYGAVGNSPAMGHSVAENQGGNFVDPNVKISKTIDRPYNKGGRGGNFVDPNVTISKTITRRKSDEQGVAEGDDDLVDLEPALRDLTGEFNKFMKHDDRMKTDPAYAKKWNKRYAKYAGNNDHNIYDDPEDDEQGVAEGWEFDDLGTFTNKLKTALGPIYGTGFKVLPNGTGHRGSALVSIDGNKRGFLMNDEGLKKAIEFINATRQRYRDEFDDFENSARQQGVAEGWNDRLPDPNAYMDYIERLRDLADIRRKEQKLEPQAHDSDRHSNDKTKDSKPPVKEGAMKDLDIAYQDYKRMTPQQFFAAYKMTKAAWMQKHKDLLKSAAMETAPDQPNTDANRNDPLLGKSLDDAAVGPMEEGWVDHLDDPENWEEYLERMRELADMQRKARREEMPVDKQKPTPPSTPAKDVEEAKYQGREVPLGKPMQGDVKKSKVYVRKPNGNIVKVNFGDKTMRIKKSNPNRRKSFRARHNCDNPGPRWKARYWSCRAW